MSEPLFDRVALIGIGLIGSSIALNVKAHGLARHVAITTRRAETLATAERLGLGDSYHLEVTDAVREADLVILCVPVGICGAITREIAPYLKAGAIISDVGSVKGAVIEQMRPHLPETVAFVPAHPLAGTEQSGPQAGFVALFQKRWCILTPLEETDPPAVERLKVFWEACGSAVEIMTAEHHDLVLAIVSHVPHLIAYNIVGTAADLETVTQSEVVKFSASGFRDFTRIAASDPTMWRDVFLTNRDAVLEMLARFSEDLASLQRAIRWGDGDTLFDLFTRTRAIRRNVIEAGQDTAKPNFGREAGNGSSDESSA
ncbi:prephenate/arogenate dehydrogenase family protein [Jiella sp. MQZ9-1]|uniref:prephenate dehydrogenase n=1 Tax=Jiella flava TaxID=2816857 RepID=A0A939JX90_9HYPH|nr:prephenate/arogenate dehydrogenase family protein [Jiella flava]MBO0663817.1 prephenate/arogenate dehydrogenase family protein [Jiella flava]MCD2472390.1 prephenate/arogenate dehydrogenase family protein [Jiella flava]